MAALGLVECLRCAKGLLTPTFRNTQGGAIRHQMDHLFVTQALAERLTACDTGSRERVFGSSPPLSDHLPIVADFRPTAGRPV
jgi:endonuclease/exonuclease/phosphatase family metal-dependent hydrolase